MLIFIQFPLVDTRLFVNEARKLSAPSWPVPAPFKEFIRSFGVVKPRTKSSAGDWVDETYICDASKSIKVTPPLRFLSKDATKKIELLCLTRHFHFDGWAVGKFEIAFMTDPKQLSLSSQLLQELLNHITDLQVHITIPSLSETRSTNLINIGKYLAEKYTFSSSKSNYYHDLQYEKYVFSGSPILFLEFSDQERIQIPTPAKYVPTEGLNIDLYHMWSGGKSNRISTWLLKRQYHKEGKDQSLRILRLGTMRLHTEYECLRLVIKLIENENIKLIEGTSEFDFLQWYLNEATKRIFRIGYKAQLNNTSDEKLKSLFYMASEIVAPSQKDALIQKLRTSRIRPQIKIKLIGIIDNLIHNHNQEYLTHLNDGSISFNSFFVNNITNIIETGGGAVIGGSVNTGGDFIGRNKESIDTKPDSDQIS